LRQFLEVRVNRAVLLDQGPDLLLKSVGCGWDRRRRSAAGSGQPQEARREGRRKRGGAESWAGTRHKSLIGR
jgi:hypothetical protein